MKNLFGIIAFAMILSSTSFAATFKTAVKFKNPELEALANEISKTVTDKKVTDIVSVSSSANEVVKYSFSRKSTEQDVNTAKQFNIKFMGIYAADESGATAADMNGKSIKEFTDALFKQTDFGNFEEDQAKILVATYNAIQDSITKHTKNMKNPTFKYFAGDHADEDGSWSVLNIIDTKNGEIFAVRFGGFGT